MILTVKNHQIIVDDEDSHLLTDYHWSVVIAKRKPYAIRGIKVNDKRYCIYLHHAVAGQHLTLQTDHRNGNSLDNRRENLRFATRQQNMQNRAKGQLKTSSQFKGVHWDQRKQRWKSGIMLNGQHVHAASFKCEIAAAKAYNAKALQLHGEFALLNSIPES